MRDFNDYYPPGSLRRAEEGEVVIAFKVSPGSKRPSDIEVIHGSGFDALDAAAFKIASSLRVSSPCSVQTVRWAFNFDYEPPEPERRPMKRTGCIVWTPRGTGYVLLVPDESTP
jgi:TonB family protein